MKRIALLFLVAAVMASTLGCRNQQSTSRSYHDQMNAEIAQEKAQKDRYLAQIKAQVATADCGPYPESYQQLAKAAIQQTLKDPDSAKFEFPGKPYKGFSYAHTDFKNETTVFCWTVAVKVNAKNSYGGYTGSKTWYVDIRDGRVINVLPGS